MGTRRKKETVIKSENSSSSSNQRNTSVTARNLAKSHLGGVIFGCTNTTITYCLSNQLFGLPAQHFSYVKKIGPGLPLFLFNYSDRKLHGIFEAASCGQLNINPYAWTSSGSERTSFPAQVQIRVRLHCRALLEGQFKPVITDNYYTPNHFWFELDHAQASKLSSMFSSIAVAPNSFAQPSPIKNTKKPMTLLREPPSAVMIEEAEVSLPSALRGDLASYNKSNGNPGSVDEAALYGSKQPSEASFDEQVLDKSEEESIFMKLKELALTHDRSGKSVINYVEDSVSGNEWPLDHEEVLEGQTNLEEEHDENLANSFDIPLVTQLIKDMEELKAFKREQTHKTRYLEQKLAAAEVQIQQLKDRIMGTESMPSPSSVNVDETALDSFDEHDLDEFIFLLGGFDGQSWLSALDSFSPSRDSIKSLKPMSSNRSYASVAKLNGELYVFGGGNGSVWYDTVESYHPQSNRWTSRPSMNWERGSLAGAALNGKIFAIGGGNGIECFSFVEMLDLDVGRWIPTRSMQEKRFSLAAAELNGALYVVGGYDGHNYLSSAERFDPREYSWTRIRSMNTRRGSHSLAVLNEKIYAIGGYDGEEMVCSTEIFDPRVGSWIYGEAMSEARGYSAAAAFKDSLYVFGGVKTDEKSVVDTVERYEEGKGWEVTALRAIGKRCFCSAIVM